MLQRDARCTATSRQSNITRNPTQTAMCLASIFGDVAKLTRGGEPCPSAYRATGLRQRSTAAARPCAAVQLYSSSDETARHRFEAAQLPTIVGISSITTPIRYCRCRCRGTGVLVRPQLSEARRGSSHLDVVLERACSAHDPRSFAVHRVHRLCHLP